MRSTRSARRKAEAASAPPSTRRSLTPSSANTSSGGGRPRHPSAAAPPARAERRARETRGPLGPPFDEEVVDAFEREHVLGRGETFPPLRGVAAGQHRARPPAIPPPLPARAPPPRQRRTA